MYRRPDYNAVLDGERMPGDWMTGLYQRSFSGASDACFKGGRELFGCKRGKRLPLPFKGLETQPEQPA